MFLSKLTRLLDKLENRTLNKYSVVPQGYRVLILPDPIEDTSKGGIVIVSDEKAEMAGQMFGEVVGIGPIAWKAFTPPDPWAKIGDRVMYSKYAGKSVTCSRTGERLVLINDEDIVATVLAETEDWREDGEVTSG